MALHMTIVRPGFIPNTCVTISKCFMAQSPGVSWNCCACGLPNFSDTRFVSITANPVITYSHNDIYPMERSAAMRSHHSIQETSLELSSSTSTVISPKPQVSPLDIIYAALGTHRLHRGPTDYTGDPPTTSGTHRLHRGPTDYVGHALTTSGTHQLPPHLAPHKSSNDLSADSLNLNHTESKTRPRNE